MARDYDTLLLESVAVRRRRLRDALLFGSQRTRRTFDEALMKVLVGLCVAAVLCAGTVGWSFLRTQLKKQEKEKAAQSQVMPPDTESAPVPASWVGTQVTFPMLRRALNEAGVPPSLYVLPGQPRPPLARTSSYYLIAKGKDEYSGGIVELRQGRIASEFPSEDEASRWLYGELAIKETPPRVLTPQAERQAAAQSADLVRDVGAKLTTMGGGTIAYQVPQDRHLDQFGQESGTVLFPYGTPFTLRGLPPSTRVTVNPAVPSSYTRYRVAKPFQMNASLSTPGGAVRFTINAGLFPRPPALPTVRWLLRNGYLERVAVAAVPK